MNNMMKLAIIIGAPLGMLIVLLLILEPNSQLAVDVYLCALLGIATVGSLFARIATKRRQTTEKSSAQSRIHGIGGYSNLSRMALH